MNKVNITVMYRNYLVLSDINHPLPEENTMQFQCWPKQLKL